jgi:CheY-like chemotaxis protein/signal transduction histidine kinase
MKFLGMDLANKITKMLMLKAEQEYGEVNFAKQLSLKVGSIVYILFFLINSIPLFLSKDIIAGIVSISSAILITIFFLIITNKRLTNGINQIIVIIPILAFSYFFWFGSITLTGTLLACLIPVVSITMLGYNRGATLSVLFLIISAGSLYAPFDVNMPTFELSQSFKISYLLSYAVLLFASFLMESIRAKSMYEMEKQMLDHKNTIKLKEEFIANLSHQIRTPLNNIMVIASLLENLSNDEKQKDMIDTIHASTNNLVNVVNSMVEISNVDIKERGNINLTFNLFSTINSTLKLFSSQDSGQVNFNLTIDDSIPENLVGDPVRIKQIFLNLIENILKNKSSSKTTIALNISKHKQTSEDVELMVELRSNKPILLPLNENQNLFVTNESTLTSASTQMYIDLLELSITQKLIESNGGKLSIALSATDAAFTFPYVFRKVTSIADALITKEVEPQVTSHMDMVQIPSVDLEKASILLVEDNLINQKIVVLSLKKLVKNIEIANNGKEALDKFGCSRYDIILMDIQMPIMNGIVATKKIREIEASSNTHTPIIAITANALLGDKEECLAAGMDDYISKPFQIEVLIQKMKNLLKSS